MKTIISLAPDLIQKARKQEIERLSTTENLSARLAEIDQKKPLKRIFIMGCGRSGTWLLTAVLSTFDDVCVLPVEISVEEFGLLSTTQSTLVLKRHFQSYARIEHIPQQIGIAYIIRHPFDVLTSNLAISENKYHIQPHRWLSEMLALQYLIDTKRANTKIIRYEDLVSDVNSVQADMGTFFGLKPAVLGDEFLTTINLPDGAVHAMHGLRKPDTNSIGRYKKEPDSIRQLKKIKPRLGRMLDWVATEFSYDILL